MLCSCVDALAEHLAIGCQKLVNFGQWLKCILIPEAFRTERHRKQAADFKIDKMVKNALEVHRVKKQESVVPTHFGQALVNFSEATPEYERVGGLRWTVKSIWNQTLFSHEGVLLSGRLISTNFIQFVVTIFILIAGISITMTAATTFDTYTARVEEFLETFAAVDVNPDSFRIFLPTDRSMVVVPMAVGVAFAFLAALFISIIVIPSASGTTLKFRSGVLAFAQDPKVKLLRIAPDQVSQYLVPFFDALNVSYTVLLTIRRWLFFAGSCFGALFLRRHCLGRCWGLLSFSSCGRSLLQLRRR